MNARIWLAWTVATLAAVQPASANLLAQAVPSKYTLTVRDEAPVSRDVSIRNLGDAPVVVKVRLSDWTMSESGEMKLLEAGATPVSLAGSIDFQPKEFSLGPGENGVIHLTLRLPEQGPATRYGVLLSEVRPTSWPATHLGPRAVAELGTTIYLSRIPADLTRAELIGLRTSAADDTTLAVSLDVKNPGERQLYSAGEIAVRDSLGAVVAQGSVGNGVVLPGARRTFTWTCSNRLTAGRYVVTAMLDTGEHEWIVGETDVRWPIVPTGARPVATVDGR
jgi:P pilus assembly chaperone PapD